MKNFSISLLSIIILVSVCGCAPFLLTLGAAGTAAVSIDTIRLERNVTYDRAWKATIAALKQQDATINTQDMESGLIQAMLKQSDITIKIAQIETRPTAIDITSRRKGIPELKTADFLLEEINTQLRPKI
ncbi:MAG: DUF3568 domain-containing protein [Candidatus Omnitrophica bacterium]|nr:DUF3568 domain-containing protein [Candidatus Omnitrophota bacterium]